MTSTSPGNIGASVAPDPWRLRKEWLLAIGDIPFLGRHCCNCHWQEKCKEIGWEEIPEAECLIWKEKTT
jgi:hypothetical protein